MAQSNPAHRPAGTPHPSGPNLAFLAGLVLIAVTAALIGVAVLSVVDTLTRSPEGSIFPVSPEAGGGPHG